MSSKPKRFKREATQIDSGNFMVSNTQLYNYESPEKPAASPDTTFCESIDPIDAHNEKIKRLNKTDSLTKLIYCIKLNDKTNMNTPKWKNFNWLDLPIKDKVRLNNAIWRTWYMQYGTKNTKKLKKSLICQFFGKGMQPFDSRDSLIVSEGKYWIRNCDTIQNEYNNWRKCSLKTQQSLRSKLLKIKASNNWNQTTQETLINTNGMISTKRMQDNDKNLLNVEPVFDTNSDLFQPDLMRFFPNFDFVCDLDDFDFKNEDFEALKSLTSTEISDINTNMTTFPIFTTNSEMQHNKVITTPWKDNLGSLTQAHVESNNTVTMDNLNLKSNDTNLGIIKKSSEDKYNAKRRHNIEIGFEELKRIVPDLRNTNSSKASILQKTGEYIVQLKSFQSETSNINKHEIELLSNQINELQNLLPATTGVLMIDNNTNRGELLRQKFKSYVQARTIQNWKFYIFSTIINPLFDNYVNTVNDATKEEIRNWQREYLKIVNLRPLLSGAIRQLSKSTSVLSNPQVLPQECYKAAIQTRKKL